MEQNKYKLPVIFFVVGLVVGFLIGYYLVGKNLGWKSTETKQLENIVALTFPRPPEDLRTVMGVITKIDGNKIQMDIGDPEDYLPHEDGSSQRMISRVGLVSDATEMYVLRPTQIDKNGNIFRETLTISGLKTGESITVTSAENVRT